MCMKKIFTLFFTSLFSLALFAHEGTRLSISTVGKSQSISVEVDGKKYNMQQNAVTISNLRDGRHNIRIYRENSKKNNSYGYGSAKRPEVIYSSTVNLKAGYHLDLLINRFGKVFTDERAISDNINGYDDYDDEYDNRTNDGRNNGDYNGNGRNNNDYEDGRWNNSNGNVMNSREFEQTKAEIRKEWQESSRMLSVKTIIDKNNFTSTQVKEMVQLFTFENNRLDVAKYAYRKTVDKNNYYQVSDLFTFGSSKDELARFIRETR